MATRWLVTIWAVAAVYLWWWTAHNPLPDGFQNEYLHIGNAADLWQALLAADQWHLRWYMYTGYWPWGFYAVPWPFLAVMGPGRAALLAGNLVHLAVLLAGTNSLGRALGARLAPLLLVLCAGVFGSLVRYEPNLAVVAWVVAGLAFLVRSSGLRERREVVGWGVALGIGLMMDRLTVAFFLVPAVLPLLWRADRRAWRNLAWGGLSCLLLTGAYYREFFLRHTGELLSQAPVGEIDAAGTVSVGGGVSQAAWYLLALLDSQAGPVIGALMLWGVGVALRDLLPVKGRPVAAGTWQPRSVLLASALVPLAFFTLLAKKQVFYTLPVLGPLAVLGAGRGRWAWLGVVGGLWAFGGSALGVVPPGFPGSPWMPERWVAPRHTVARPPSRQRWPLDEAIASIQPDGGIVAVLSEDERLFEGFVVLAVRERLPGEQVRGVVLDPVGTYEQFAETGWMLWAGPRGGGWPDLRDVQRELLDDHYDVSKLPPVARVVAGAASEFEEVGRWRADDVDLVLFRRLADDPPQSTDR